MRSRRSRIRSKPSDSAIRATRSHDDDQQTAMTSSSSVPGARGAHGDAPARPATACSSSTAPRSPATRYRPISSIHLASLPCCDGASPDRSGHGCPPIHTYAFDFGPFTLTGSPGTTVAVATRRGAPCWTRCSSMPRRPPAPRCARASRSTRSSLTPAASSASVAAAGTAGRSIERAPIVVGADGGTRPWPRRSRPKRTTRDRRLQASYYSYWSGLPMPVGSRPTSDTSAAFAAWPTNDDLTWSSRAAVRRVRSVTQTDIEGNFLATIDLAPAVRRAAPRRQRARPVRGHAVPNYFRRPFGSRLGPGRRRRIQRGFRHGAGHQRRLPRRRARSRQRSTTSSAGSASFDEAMAAYQAARDEHVRPFYEFTTQLAALEPPPPEFAQALAGIVGNQPAMDRFVRVTAGVTHLRRSSSRSGQARARRDASAASRRPDAGRTAKEPACPSRAAGSDVVG